MEAHADMDTTNSNSLGCATNWSIPNGSLLSIINLDSSSDSTFLVDDLPQFPLLFVPPSPHSSICEIKISFTLKYDIRQFFIRSTARSCELYYAPDLESINEYLCTVRSNIVVRDVVTEEEFVNRNGEGNADSKGQKGHLIGEELMGEMDANEDDWLVVNFPDSPMLDNTENNKEFYEATTEIANPQPCMSLTLHFPSIQHGESLYVDEIYVFALPIEPKNNPTCNKKMESLMEQLVAKVSSIEDLFLWFKENMVKPINNIEARLERVEQQLKEISLNSGNGKAKAPEYSENENRDQILDYVSISNETSKGNKLYEGRCSSPLVKAKHDFKNEDYEDREEAREGEACYGLLTGSKSIAEAMITLTKFHFLMDSDGCDGDAASDTVGGRLQDNYMYFNQQLFAFPREAVCFG